jgi:hypothetical protein
MEGRSKSGSVLAKLLLLGASLTFALAGLEVIVRVRQHWKYGSAAATVHDFTIDPASGLRIPVPGSNRAGIAINSLGFRGPEIAVPKPEGTIRLAFLGASTTYCAEVSSNELVWPHLVTVKLQEQYPGVRFDYINAAVPGYSTEQSLKNFETRVAHLQPDVVVFYEATNDLAKDVDELAGSRGLAFKRLDESSGLA